MYINPTAHITQRVFKNINQLNILTCPSHERYETGLSATGHSFYALRAPGIKDWKEQYAPVPKNYTVMSLDKGEDQIPPHLAFDLVLSQNKFGQFQILSQIAAQLDIPLISLEHTLPMPNWPQNVLEGCRNARGTANVFISEFSMNQWGWQDKGDTYVIEHMVDQTLFTLGKQERKNHILTVANDYIGRDWCLNFTQYKNVCLKNNLPVRPVGDTPGLSLPAKNTTDLVNEYQTSRVFFNTAHISPIPTSLLEAMSCGCACVSIDASAIGNYITHGKDGFLYKTDEEAKYYLELLLEDEELATSIGKEASKTIAEKCSSAKFIESWNTLFRMVI